MKLKRVCVWLFWRQVSRFGVIKFSKRTVLLYILASLVIWTFCEYFKPFGTPPSEFQKLSEEGTWTDDNLTQIGEKDQTERINHGDEDENNKISNDNAREIEITGDKVIEGIDLRTNNDTSYFDPLISSHQLTQKTVLIFSESSIPTVYVSFLQSQSIEYDISVIGQDIPTAVVKSLKMSKYTMIFFEYFSSYVRMNLTQKFLIDTYCKQNSVAIFSVSTGNNTEMLDNLKLKLQHQMSMKQYRLNSNVTFWRIAKPGMIFQQLLPSSDWTIFLTNHVTYVPLAFSTAADDWPVHLNENTPTEFSCVVAVLDRGLLDGVKRIIFGHDINFWLNAIVAMDAMAYLSQGKLGLPLERLVQIDVDDMFTEVIEKRRQVDDVEKMIASQLKIRQYVPGFKYVVGLSGAPFQKRPLTQVDENSMIKLKKIRGEFVWFNHMFHHEKTHNLNGQEILGSILKNEQYARENNISIYKEYMVTPFHSGILPVHEDLYDLWRAMRQVVCTSTVVYSTWPNNIRRGFVYKGIMVIPRQTCSLYTRTFWFENYPGGKKALDLSIRGGTLFNIFLYTPVMVFMTHMSNFENAHLAQYSFENVLEFVSQWTNLRLVSLPPVELCKRYFQLHPNEVLPIWKNPWDLNIRFNIISKDLSERKFPTFLIVGPDAIGARSFSKLLTAHPTFLGQFNSSEQNIRFFSTDNYDKGIHWYQRHFPELKNKTTLLFEKGSDYFYSEVAPQRVSFLLPRANIIVILDDPAKRAYSCYQRDITATKYTFYGMVTATDADPVSLRAARDRCLDMGMYSQYLEAWFHYFPEKIVLIDGDVLVNDPAVIMHGFQEEFKVEPFVNYTDKLSFNIKTDQYCLQDQECWNQGDANPSIDVDALQFLSDFFKEDKMNLRTLLQNMSQPYPTWLKRS